MKGKGASRGKAEVKQRKSRGKAEEKQRKRSKQLLELKRFPSNRFPKAIPAAIIYMQCVVQCAGPRSVWQSYCRLWQMSMLGRGLLSKNTSNCAT
jgi:hypothetical protein